MIHRNTDMSRPNASYLDPYLLEIDLLKTLFWTLSRQTVFLQNLLTTSDFYSVAFLIHLTAFLKGILPLYVCSFFTGVLTKSSFCTSTSFFKSCKNRERSFCRPQGFPGQLRALRGNYFTPVAL